MRRWALAIIVVIAIAGITVASISTKDNFRIQREGLENPSFCAISEKVNCDVVNASSYAKLLGIPTSSWGIIFYSIIAIFSLISFFLKDKARATVSILWFMSILGILFSLYLSYITLHVLDVVCIECLSLYVVNIFLFIFLFVALKIRVRETFQFVTDYIKAIFGKQNKLGFSPKFFPHAIAIAVIFFIGWLLVGSVQAKAVGTKEAASVEEKIKAFYMGSLYSIEPDPKWPMWGNPNAKVTMIEFSEFQCPFCRLSAFNVKPRLQEFKNDVRLYFVNYPLDQACNDEIKQPMHQNACLAAKAAVCAAKNGEFWKYHDDLFKNQKVLSNQLVLDLAEKMGWNKDEFKSCIDAPETEARIKSDIETAKRARVSGTPTIILNNRHLIYWRDSEFLQDVIKEEIKKSKNK